MTTNSSETKVLVILGASITIGAVILNILGHNPPSAGAFCLSQYNSLCSVKESILSRAVQSPGRWSRAEIYFSGTESGNIEYLASLNDVGSPEHIECHFVICNGNGGRDGQIQATEKWERQSSGLPLVGTVDETTTDQTIYICVIADGEVVPQTDFQIKRTEALVEELSRTFNIQPDSIRYPDDWQ